MEGFEKQQNLSEEQQEKVAELLPIVKEKFDSFTTSDDAYETADSINRLYEYIKEEGKNPKDFFLWSLLVPSTPDISSKEFDTPDGDIETFIRNLSHTEAGE